MNSIRIDPADSKGIHLVQNDGGERIYIKLIEIPKLIEDLREVVT